jgi:hypothetical protein
VDKPEDVELDLRGLECSTARLKIEKTATICDGSFGEERDWALEARPGDDVGERDWFAAAQVGGGEDLKEELKRGLDDNVIGIDRDRKDRLIVALQPEEVEVRRAVRPRPGRRSPADRNKSRRAPSAADAPTRAPSGRGPPGR